MKPESWPRALALTAALTAAAAVAFAAGTKTSGTTSIVDDLTGGSSGSTALTAAGVELEGALGQTASGIASSGQTQSSGGFFAPAVTAPAGVAVTGVAFSSITLGWSDAAPANPVGTSYVAELSTASDFSGTLVSSQTPGFVVTLATLAANATHYIRVRAEFGGAEASPFVFLSTVSAIEPPTSVFFEKISSNSITASAYAEGTAFSSMTAGMSGANVARAGAYAGWGAAGWSAFATPGPARFAAAGAELDGRFYVIGGIAGADLPTVDMYDPVANAWSSRANLLSARNGLGAASAGGRLYAVGGYAGASVPNVESYDPAANQWTSRAPLPVAAHNQAVAAAAGKIYAMGGDPPTANNFEFDPDSEAWTARSPLPVARGGAAAAALDGRIYVTAGFNSGFADTKRLDRYDPAANAWTPLADLPSVRNAHRSVALGGKVWVLGGMDPSYLSAVVRYDPAADAWTGEAPMPTARRSMAVAAVGGRIYAVAGFNGASLSASERYDAGVTSSFTALSPNTLYGFRAKARNSLGVETGETATVSTYTLAVATLPRNGEALFSDLTASSVTVNWSSGTDSGGFNGPGASYLAQMSTMATFIPVWQSSQTYALSARLTGFMTQTTHYFRVRAYNSANVTDYSWTVLGSTRADYVPPNAPSEVAASVMGASNTLRVRWRTPGNDGSLGALPAGSEFRVQWATGPFATIDWSTANAQVVIATGPLNPGLLVSTDVAHLPRLTTATFRVWASDDFGNWSLASGSAPMTVSPFAYEKVTGDGVSAGESAGTAMDRFGNLHVVYKDATLPGLRYVKREGGVWQAPTTAFPGTVNSIVAAVDPDGVVHAAYYNATAGEMAYARYDGSWSSATVHVLTTAGPGGIVVGPRGLVMISYSDYNNGDLRFAWGSGKTWMTEAVDAAGQANNGVPSALALDASGNPRIAYTLPTGGSSAYNLKYAERAGNGQWTLSEIRPQSENLSQPTLNLDRDGRPRITYYRYSGVDSVFYVADSGSGFIPPVLIGKTTNGLNSATLDGNGGLHVAYYLQPADDLVYSYSGDGGASWSSHTVDSDGLVGYPVQPIAVDGSGAVHIVYHDQSNADVKAARWEPGAHGPAFGGRSGSAVQAPTAFDGNAVGASSITFRWIDGASNELGFRVYLSSGGSINEAFSLAVASSVLGPLSGVGSLGALTLTDLTPNTSYQAYVAAVGNGGVVMSSASKAIYTSIEAPTSVEFLSVSSEAVVAVATAAGTGFSNLSLGTSAVNIALNTVYQGWVVGSSVTVSSGLVPNTLYSFKARARGVAGLETAESGAFSTRTLAAVPQAGSPGVYAAFVTSASVQWTANNNPSPATEYRVHASTAEDFNAGASSTVVAWVTSLSTQVTGLIPYTTWHFRVQARNADGRESDYALLGSTVPLLFRVRPIVGSASDIRDVVWGDYDRDGDLDLAVAAYSGAPEYVLRDDGSGPASQIPVTGTAGDSLGVAWGDYDGDGDLDLAIANDVGQNEVIGRNDGGSFTAVTLSGTAGNSSAVAWGDFDRDGDLDLAIANQGTQDEVVMRNDGGGTFFKITVAGSGRDSKGIAWGDFDGDGDLDLLVANSAGQNETLLRYDGGTTFTVVDLAGTGGNTRSVAVADFDGDGDLDFAAANELNDDYVARNDGTGTFARTDFPGTDGYSHKAVWGDYDGDGDLDLAVGNYNGSEKYLARNTAGSFSTITVFGSAGAGWGLAWGDTDRDGALDLAVGESGSDAYLLVNQGGVVNSSPMAPGAPAFSLAYGVTGTTLTVAWPPSFDAESSTGLLSYALVAATAPMSLTGDGQRILSPSSFLVSWNYGSPLFGANARPQSALRLDLGGLAAANLKSDATYYFRLQTVDAGLARSSWSVESSTFVYKDLPPQGRTLAQVNASSVAVAYTGVGATLYFVEASTTDFVGGVSVSSATLSTGAVSLAPQGLTPNTTYYLRMGGLWQRTTSYAATVPSSTATLANAPATAVTTFTAVFLSSFNVAWSSNSNPAPTEYRLETSTASDWSGLGDVVSAWFTGTSTSAVGLAPNATAYVRVQARNHPGIETDWTALGSTVTGAAQPAPPAGSSFTAVAQTSVTLSWGLGTNPADTQFQVRASTAPDFSGLDAFSAWLAAQTTTLSGLSADTTYHWRVTARNRNGVESEARDFGAQATAPYEPAPSSAPYHALGASSATVQWRPSGNPPGTSYEAQLSTSAAFGGEVLSSGWVASLSTTVSGLTGDSTYYLRARARGVGGTVTAWTALASSPTLAADPDTLSGASVGPGAMRAVWPSMGNREADALGVWSVRTSLPAALERQGTALLNGRLYAVGGVKGGAPTAEVWSAGVSPAGTIGAWRREADLPAPRESHGVAAFGGRLYAVGGFDGSAKSTVYSAEVSPDGRVAGWNTDSSLPAARSKLAVVAHDGWLYAIGGDNGVVSQTAVYRTAVDAKGKLVGWAAAAALPAARNSHAAAVAGGRVYVAGGLGAGVEEEVWSAALSGPSVGPWTVETPLPAAVFRHALLASGGALVSVGGHDGTGAVAAVRSARLRAGGVVGVWESLEPLPAGRFGHGAALETGNILVAGGADDSAAAADAYQAALGGTEYLLERAQDAGFSVDYASSNWRAGAGAELAGLTPNSLYFLRVRVRSRAGAEGALVVSASTRTPAAVPASAASTFSLVEAGSMTLTWASGGNPAGTEFLAAVSTSVDFTASLNTGWVAAVSSAVFGLTPNTSYYAGVVARDAGGTNTREVYLGSTVTAAAVPESPSFPTVVTTGLSVEWSTAGNPSGTLYEAQLAAAASFSPLAASTVTTSTGTSFTGLLSASTYYFRVRALNRLATPTGFSPTTAAVTGADFTAPAAAGGPGLHATETPGVLLAAWTSPGDDGGAGVLPAGSRVYLQWSAAAPASVAWSTANAQLSAATGPVTPGAPASLIVTGLPVGSSVYARVWTLDESDNVSAPSAVASVWASPFTLTVLDGAGQDAGRWVSAALDRSGNAHAAYTAGTITQELRYMTRSGGVWSVAEAPDPGIPADEVVLAMGPSYPQVAYRNSTTGQLRLAKRAAGWSAAAVASGDLHPGGLAVDATSYAHISYYDAAVGLRYARWNGVSWDLETVDAGAGRGRFSSLALDGASAPHVAYYDATAGDLKFASRTAAGAWATSTVEAAVDAGSVPVVALDGDGHAVIAYVDANSKDLKLARFDGSAWALETVDAGRDVTGVRGLALDAAGRPVVTYYDGTAGDLLLARSNGTGWETGAVDSYGDVGAWSGAAVESDGSVLELHYDAGSSDLKAGTWNAGLGAALAGNPRGRSQAPAAFSGVVASSVGIQWTWVDSAAGELGWRLYGGLTSTGPFSVVAGTAALPATAGTGTQRLYTETGLTFGTTYYRYVAAVSSGGVVPSPMAALFPFDTVDVTPPTATDNQAGSAVWRRSSGTVYDVDFQDTGGSALTKFQVKAATVPGGAGPDVVAYTDVAVNILADNYTADWALPAAVFNGLHDGATNYLSVRVFDGAGNTGVLADVFTVLKDTTPPTLADNQAGDAARRAVGGTLYDVDALDPASGLERLQYSVSTTVASGDAARVGWTDIPLGAGATSYVADWAVDFAALLGDSPNYVSVRAWDRAGSTSTLTDAFIVSKDTGGPRVGVTAPAAAFRSVLTVLAGTAADDAGVGGVQVAVQTAPPTGDWFDGSAFTAGGPFWLAASGTATWTFAGVPAWTNGGAFRVVARATDTLGNLSVAYSTADFTFDSSTPTAGVTSPADGAALAVLATLAGTASDPGGAASGLARIDVVVRRAADGFYWGWSAGAWAAGESSTSPAVSATWSLPLPEALRSTLAHGASYFVSARAVDGAVPANTGSLVSGSTFSWTDTVAPAAVTNLSALTGAGPGILSLTWTAPGDDGATGDISLGSYRIHYSTIASTVFSSAAAQVEFSTSGVKPGALQGRLVTGLTAGATYHARIFMADDAGNWSALSNGATAYDGNQPFNKIIGHVMKASSEGITAVKLEAYDSSEVRVSQAFSLADGSGTFSLNGVPDGVFRVLASWTADDITSSVWLDNIAVGSFDVDFMLEINYSLSTLTGTLSTLAAQTASRPGFMTRAAESNFAESRVDLLRGGEPVAAVRPDPTGRWNIPNLLPGRYAVRAFNGLDYTDPQDVQLGEGETREVVFVFDPLPEASVFAFPNPARTQTTFRLISALPDMEAQVAVFDIAGNLVKEIPGSAFVAKPGGLFHADWGLTNDQGEPVASGVYLFMVKVKGSNGQSGKVVKKLAVVR